MQIHDPLPDEPLSSDQQLREEDEVDNTKCSICEANFADKFTRDRHIHEVHFSLGRIKCTNCDLTFQRREFMSKHRVKVHPASNAPDSICDRDKSKRCGICEKIYFDISSLNRHIRDIHGGDKIHGCEECSAHYFRREDLENHVKKGKHWITLGCRYCHQDIVFKSYSAFRDHYVAWYGRKKNTCVNAMKMREADPDFDKKRCSDCKEKIPEGEYFSGHTISDPEEPGSNVTCLTVLKKRKFIQCTCCRERLNTSTSEWIKHFYIEDRKSYDFTDCNRMLEWRRKVDLRGWQPSLIKGILLPRQTAHMPIDDPCHERYPLHPLLPLPCWTHGVITSLLGNSLHTAMEGEARLIWYASEHSSGI